VAYIEKLLTNGEEMAVRIDRQSPARPSKPVRLLITRWAPFGLQGSGRSHARRARAEQSMATYRTRIAAAMAVGLWLAGCQAAPSAQPLGSAEVGAAIMARHACGSCHRIPGIALADGNVGPPLDGVGRRIVIAGRLPNSADNMVHWLRDPQAVEPGNAMPDVGLSEQEARNVAAYLYTLG
jgi:cytochrome c